MAATASSQLDRTGFCVLYGLDWICWCCDPPKRLWGSTPDITEHQQYGQNGIILTFDGIAIRFQISGNDHFCIVNLHRLLQKGCKRSVSEGSWTKAPSAWVRSERPNGGIHVSYWAKVSQLWIARPGYTLRWPEAEPELNSSSWSGSSVVAERGLSTLASSNWRRKHIGAISHPFMWEIAWLSDILSLYCERRWITLEEPLAWLHYPPFEGWAGVGLWAIVLCECI